MSMILKPFLSIKTPRFALDLWDKYTLLSVYNTIRYEQLIIEVTFVPLRLSIVENITNIGYFLKWI